MVFNVTQKPQLLGNILLVPIENCEGAQLLLNDYTDKPHTCEIREKKAKRSLEANGYMWALCAEISKVLSNESPTSKEDVYRRAVRDGNCYYPVPVKSEAVAHYQKIWSSNGIGWFAEEAYKSKTLEGYTTLHAYYGSSEYNTTEMWQLIRIIQDEAQSMGVETRTPAELESMMSAWDKAVKRNA
ncbi:MAG: hypothetical protein WC455_22105 [Dehalococcoidia bacterium]|jgi:hypothetical protein